jgi:hypothetical protein
LSRCFLLRLSCLFLPRGFSAPSFQSRSLSPFQFLSSGLLLRLFVLPCPFLSQ